MKMFLNLSKNERAAAVTFCDVLPVISRDLHFSGTKNQNKKPAIFKAVPCFIFGA